MKDAAKLLLFTFMVMAGVLLLMVIRDIIAPVKPIEVNITPDMIVYPEEQVSDYWDETAHALGVDPGDLTMEEYIEHSDLQTKNEVREYMKSR